MKKLFIAILFISKTFLTHALAQETNTATDVQPEKSTENDVTFVSVEHMPKFPGGEDAMFKYIGNNVVYPKAAQKAGISGVVYIYFIIDKLGNVTKAEVKRGVKGGEELNAEALRVINSMPKWEPGYQNGKPASVQLTLPIKFVL
jgi:protein TonB